PLLTQNSKLKTQNSKLKTQNSKLKTQNSKLKTQNSKLKTQNSKLKTQNSKLKTQHYPFTAPAVSPPSIKRWNIRVSAISGTVTTIVAAIMSPHGTSKPPPVVVLKLKMARGTVKCSAVWVKDRAYRNSF